MHLVDLSFYLRSGFNPKSVVGFFLLLLFCFVFSRKRTRYGKIKWRLMGVLRYVLSCVMLPTCIRRMPVKYHKHCAIFVIKDHFPKI